MKINKQKLFTVCMILLGVFVSGCGKEKNVDEASSKVIQISVAPVDVTPTPAPDQVDSAAVVTNGNLTMVNDYLADQSTSDISDSDSSDNGGNVDTNTDNNGTDTNNNTDANADSNTDDSAGDSGEE